MTSKLELQAIIFAAGKGSRITELTGSIPKCLLPIANKPVIHYPISMLIEADFKDAIIIVADNQELEVKNALSNLYPQINLEYFSIPSNKDFGTADSLRLISYKIKTDVLLLTCDIVSDFNLKKIINFYRIHNPTLAVLITNQSSVATDGIVPGRKSKLKTEKDLIGIDTNNSERLALLNSEVDFEDVLSLKMSTIKLCPNIVVYSKYLDSHVYILKNYVINYIVDKKQISSIKGELLPYLIKMQFKNPANEDNDFLNDSNSKTSSLKQENLDSKNIFAYAKTDEMEKTLNKYMPNKTEESNKDKFNKYPNSLIKCFALIVDNETNFLGRANNLLSYYELNKRSKSIFYNNLTTNLRNKHISSDCIISPKLKQSEHFSVKSSIIGDNCTLGEKVQITNCVIMDNVIIEDNSIIKNSILCSNVHVCKNSEIKDCILANNQVSPPSAKFSNETIIELDQMMEF